ncbi:MAG: extracellular solute-binding protein [Clostridia bacterium]|nr:extracellular solute-binding protein [Clostridia bacterium]
MKKGLSLLLALALALSVTMALGEDVIKLSVWGAEEDQAMLGGMIEAFKEANPDKNFEVTLGVCSESIAKDTVLTDLESAPDVFAFADDQLNELLMAGALQEVLLNPETVIEANGGPNAAAVQAASEDGKLFAYPMTADNGYFMFYDKSYFTEEDVKSLDRMMEVAAASGKKITMQLDSGWYLYSFFSGAGLTMKLAEDGSTNQCDWNAVDTPLRGVDVVEALLAVTANPGFIGLNDGAFVSGIKDGSIIAGVNGVWNAQVAEEAWGENYAATKLPAYTVAGQQVQMASFAGCKLVGVSAYSKQTGYAMLLAEWLTNEENQVTRFEKRGLGPSNVKAGSSETVKASPAIAALAEQAQFATIQRVGGNYWAPTETFGSIMYNGNPDNTDLQTLLDNLVAGITAPVE